MKKMKTNKNSSIIFCIEDEEVIKITEDGFYYKGKLIEKDKEIYRAMVKFLIDTGYYHPSPNDGEPTIAWAIVTHRASCGEIRNAQIGGSLGGWYVKRANITIR